MSIIQYEHVKIGDFSIFIENMQDNYQSKCDPRLNGYQCISIVSSLCDLIIKKYN